MGQHDNYGKNLLRKAAGKSFVAYGSDVEINYGAGLPARIDGVVAGNIAVEVESRVSKQIRGAVLDLICHTLPKKLLIVLPVHASNPTIAVQQCQNIMKRFVSSEDFQIVLARGTGDRPKYKEDIFLIKQALSYLGYEPVGQ